MLTPPYWWTRLESNQLPAVALCQHSTMLLAHKMRYLLVSATLGFKCLVLGSNVSTFFHSVLSGFPGWSIQLIRSIALSMVIHYQRCYPNWRTWLDLNQRTPFYRVGFLAGSWIKPLSHTSMCLLRRSIYKTMREKSVSLPLLV